MKIGAHPMVVAVALGLLGPNALAEEAETRATGSTSGASCDRQPVPAERCGEACACFGPLTPVDRNDDGAALDAAWGAMIR